MAIWIKSSEDKPVRPCHPFSLQKNLIKELKLKVPSSNGFNANHSNNYRHKTPKSYTCGEKIRDDSDDVGESAIHASSGSRNTSSAAFTSSSPSSVAEVSAFSNICLMADSFCWNFSTVHTVLTLRSVLRTRTMDSDLTPASVKSTLRNSWENFYHSITE